jgi:ethanolamine permease
LIVHRENNRHARISVLSRDNKAVSDIETPIAATSLQTNSLGWFEIASLGVAIAISGNFSGWNYGLALGGWGGMLAAAGLMAMLYVGITQIVGELAAAYPSASGFDQYVSLGLGTSYGRIAGMALFAGLALGTGLAASFISAYADSIAGIGGWPLKVGLILAVVVLQTRGARDSVRVTLLAGIVALTVLVGFCAAMLPKFHASNLLTLQPGLSPTLFPSGLAGIFGCVPFALFFFIGVEQAALGAAEAKDVSRTVPLALTIAISTALVIGFGILIVATGAAGVRTLSGTDDPLYAAVSAGTSGAVKHIAANLIGLGAIVSLLATFFSLSYAASRQAYALALAGDFPALLSRTNARHAPHWGLFAVAVIGTAAAAFDPSVVMVVFVFLLNVAYQFTLAAFVALRRRQPTLARPFRAAGGVGTAAVSSVLSLIVLASCVQLHALVTLCALAAVGAYALLNRCFNSRI